MNHFNHKIHNRFSENVYFFVITKHTGLYGMPYSFGTSCFQVFLGVFSIQMLANIRHIQMGTYIADCCKDRSKKWRSRSHIFMGHYEYQYGALHLNLIVFFTNSPKCRKGRIGHIFVEELHLKLNSCVTWRWLYSTHSIFFPLIQMFI